MTSKALEFVRRILIGGASPLALRTGFPPPPPLTPPRKGEGNGLRQVAAP